MHSLSEQRLTYLSGVGPQRADLLQKELGIVTYEDLLYYFPYKYIDRSRFYTIREIHTEMPYIQLKGTIQFFDTVGEGRRKRLIGKFSDHTGVIDLIWFQGLKYITNKYLVGKEYIVFGKPTHFGHSFSIVHPEIDTLEDTKQVANGFTPFYHTSERMKKSFIHSRVIQNMQYTLLSSIQWSLPETLPKYIVEKKGFISLSLAMKNIHFPESSIMLEKAKNRLKFDELFYIQLNILRTSQIRKSKLNGLLFSKVGAYFNQFYHQFLPFELTEAQKRVMREIRVDMGKGRQMNRLLQGDVGSGKTLVALMSMLIAVDNGYQSCMMAPTEILAQQHFSTIKKFLKTMDIKVALLTGSTKKKEREQLLPAILSGEIAIVIGTHALIESTVQFHALGLAVIDEQHRFGVEQRAKLWLKNSVVPHVLIMTATPIPRTLAMTLYGDLDVSVIDELPPGRKPIKTLHRYDNKKKELYLFLQKELALGRQIYVVYPLIEESEKLDYKNLESGYETFKEVFQGVAVGMVHGKMKPKEKEESMDRFVSGETKILVATTVIEVGVNVPNASVMVIESAERFGLSQMHQLRGRVGRGADQSYCILISSYKLSDHTRKRLEMMVNSSDGFEIAEEDLRLRGHGDLEGTQQSGDGLYLKIANLASDGAIIQDARNIASEILQQDPSLDLPHHKILRERLKELFARKINWGLIS